MRRVINKTFLHTKNCFLICTYRANEDALEDVAGNVAARSDVINVFHKIASLRASSPFEASSETQGQILGARESLNGRKNMARRKVKNDEKSPWGQCLPRPIPNGRCRSAF